MRRSVVLLVVMMVVLAVAGGAALAATIDGTRGDDRIRGTNARDQLNGEGGADVLWGLTACFTATDPLDGTRHARRSPWHPQR